MEKSVTGRSLRQFQTFLIQEEKSPATVQKYMRELQRLTVFLDGMKISKQKILEYRERLVEIYQPKTVNTKLSAVNAYLEFSGLSPCTVKLLKIQRQAFADEEKELSEQEYRRLLQAAKRRSNHRLYYVILTIGGTGIRVSELKFITVEALKNRKVQIHLKGERPYHFAPPKTAEKAESVCKNTVYPSGAGISDQKRKTIGQEQHLSRDEGDLPGGGRGSKKSLSSQSTASVRPVLLCGGEKSGASGRYSRTLFD